MSPEGREPLKGERLKKLEFRYVGSIDPADEVEEEVLRRRNKRIRVAEGGLGWSWSSKGLCVGSIVEMKKGNVAPSVLYKRQVLETKGSERG